MRSNVELLQASPFFEVFTDEQLETLAEHARLLSVNEGTVFLNAGEQADTLYMLVVGSVELFFPEAPAAVETGEPGRFVFVRTIAEPGRPIGWSALVEPYQYRASAVARQDTQLLAFDREWLEKQSHEDVDFGVLLMEQILWVLGNRLRETRVRLVAQRYEKEAIAIRAVLDQNAEQISVASPLHKLPTYLENRLTLSDAFHALDILAVHGDETERNLAELCGDILKNVRRELQIYQQLQMIYEQVANSPQEASPRDIRERCNERFISLFESVNYVVQGAHNLPETSGHIFIMNHLQNHRDNTLPNDFALTLDTHFVSSMLLQRKYGSAPIRVIRKSRPDEYGHQGYYDRLGYIYVYAGPLDGEEEGSTSLEERRRQFYETAGAALRGGQNLVLCPEGDSTTTERSPLPFKGGVFRLASLVSPEPYIVPIAVANFDKKLTTTTVAAIVHEPFRMSDVAPEPLRGAALMEFTERYRELYRGYVQEAVELAASAAPVDEQHLVSER